MSSNKSQNFKLHLWEPQDNFLRTEFNENFSTLDSAVKAEETTRAQAVQQLQNSINSTGGSASIALEQVKKELSDAIDQANASADAAQATADAAWSPDNPAFVTGNYTGTGDANSKTITVGFKPQMAIVVGNGYCYVGIGPNSCAVSTKAKINWTNTGFSIAASTAEECMNVLARHYYYAAFR